MGNILSSSVKGGESIAYKDVDHAIRDAHFVTTLEDYAAMAADTYSDKAKKLALRVIDCPPKLAKEGYFGRAYAFLAGKDMILVIAHRGADGVSDLDDLTQARMGKYPDQYAYAYKFTTYAMKLVQKSTKGKLHLEHTGYGFGSVLAELCALNPKYPGRAISFNGYGVKKIAAKTPKTLVEKCPIFSFHSPAGISDELKERTFGQLFYFSQKDSEMETFISSIKKQPKLVKVV
ncbi:hypothetical protein ADUPG1_014861 [Aduncisulcus paluster]|uniref:Uncharacterized protein n=1 Tax=Aduncisulcus paluster TaxID=2918883 RepID=A0ABQ5KBE9_9EUKA|nr:hypothetical protein ADUPG1_014861 [Aduncisulcus paluster]|eukprot:gnl/Carplike_NY0171/946_a1301_1836.p1 GENE.gnl/Carplike_NY0171/946_a1301_1836~~gnl/Carplike_NY0171/946_a1301_1836.p1  ORF type:complete len:246 (+),score=52.76 gnl/Carplike_NY0171/946_a1301_1836:40-738(+)